MALLVESTTIFAREEIRTYTIPKENKPTPQVEPGAPVKWKVPAGWQERTPGNMVIGSLAVPGKDGKNADVSITSFPGTVGSELDNVNRWRAQLRLPAVSEVPKSEAVVVGGVEGKLYDFAGEQMSIIVASIPRNGQTWFFKLKGDTATVEGAKPAFREFLHSVQFTDSGEPADSAEAHVEPPNFPATGADPHAGLANQSADPHAGLGNSSTDSDSSGPKMDPPSEWKEKAPGPNGWLTVSRSASGGPARTTCGWRMKATPPAARPT